MAVVQEVCLTSYPWLRTGPAEASLLKIVTLSLSFLGPGIGEPLARWFWLRVVMRVQPDHGFFGGQMRRAELCLGISRYLSGLVISLASLRVSSVVASG